MDDTSKKFMEDCFLRPNNPSTSNTFNKPLPSKVALKTEMQVLRLTDDSQNMAMEILRSIYGNKLTLELPEKYKDRGFHMKQFYWEDSGTLRIQSATGNFVKLTSANEVDLTDPEERLRYFAVLKLQNYGFPRDHCIEAYNFCAGETDKALILLYHKYMRIQDNVHPNKYLDSSLSDRDLLGLREEERSALVSIYDDAFLEKEQNVWSLKFRIEHFLKCDPSGMQKNEAVTLVKSNRNKDGKSTMPRCRNFDKDGACKFGPKCRFAHILSTANEANLTTKDSILDENDDKKWLYLEVQFPAGTKYPYEAPYIYSKTANRDFPHEFLLHISRKLYREACEMAQDGMPCVYALCEQLKTNQSICRPTDDNEEPFPDIKRSLFYTENPKLTKKLCDSGQGQSHPTHYEHGQTAHRVGFQRSTLQERENRNLIRKFLERQTNEQYCTMMATRQKFPAFKKMIEILAMIKKYQVVVISGETGCGKSTQVPQFILDNWLFQSSKWKNFNQISHIEIICTQPRRLSAIGVAARVAEERAEHVGQVVGYQIRLESKISAATRLTFCTTGILLRRLASETLLESITHVIVDEIHERTVESDFLLMSLKSILRKRTDLKIILMSATLNAKLFSDYFDGAPIVDIPGRTHPVEKLFMENILELCDYVMEWDSEFSRKIKKKEAEKVMKELDIADVKSRSEAPPENIADENLNLSAFFVRYKSYTKTTRKTLFLIDPMKINTDLIEAVLKYIVQGENKWPHKGTILIFLPGLQEIRAVHETISNNPVFGPRGENVFLVPLHSALSSEEQTNVFRPAPEGRRKIVLSTNIAETSITIDDCVFVIDCGLMKEKRFDSNRNMETLDLVWISRANALQRRGRAGRVMPGICIHLYTANRFHHNILDQPVPEIHRVPLEQLLLRIKTSSNFDKENLAEVFARILEPPTEQSIISAINRLHYVGAFDDCQNLTALGHHLAALPVDVRIGKFMLYGAIFQCLDSVLTIAACLSHRPPFVTRFNKRSELEKCKREFSISNSDHLTVLQAYKKWLEISKRGYQASRSYADENFLSLKTLQTIGDLKYQFLEQLVSIGFVPVEVPKKRNNSEDNVLELTGRGLNLNGNNNRLLISLLCAALYPNIAKVLTPERTYIQTASGALPKISIANELRFKTHGDGFVTVHPSSVNSGVGAFQTPFLLYQEKVRTSRIFIRDCSVLPLVSLMLFSGSDFKIELHNGDFFFVLGDGWIIVKAQNRGTAELIQCLRRELQIILEEKIRDPCLNLLHHEKARKIIHNIIYLIAHNN